MENEKTKVVSYSLPVSVVEFVERQSEQSGLSRSQVVAFMLRAQSVNAQATAGVSSGDAKRIREAAVNLVSLIASSVTPCALPGKSSPASSPALPVSVSRSPRGKRRKSL